MGKIEIILITTLIIILLFPAISAVEISMKSEFSQGETLTARVSGNFQEQIEKENVLFYRGHVKIPITYDISKIQNEYYIYAQLLDKQNGNYSLALENVRYAKGSQIIDDSIIKNFTITNKTADFYVEPGFVTTNEDFFIKLQNLQDYKIDIKIKTSTTSSVSSSGDTGGFLDFLFGSSNKTQNNGNSQEQETIISLKSGEIKKIDFSIKNIKETILKNLEFSTGSLFYNIPVYIYANKTLTIEKQKDMSFDSIGLNVSMPPNTNTTRIIYLKNTGETTLENISLIVSDSLKPYISLSADSIEELEENSTARITISIRSDGSEKTIEGDIKAKSSVNEENVYAYFTLILNSIKGYIPSDDVNETLDFAASSKICSELNGSVCKDDEKCKGTTERAKDSLCCIGNCEKTEEDSTGKIIGWAIVVAIVVFLIWFFKKKYRGARKDVDLLKIGKGKK